MLCPGGARCDSACAVAARAKVACRTSDDRARIALPLRQRSRRSWRRVPAAVARRQGRRSLVRDERIAVGRVPRPSTHAAQGEWSVAIGFRRPRSGAGDAPGAASSGAAAPPLLRPSGPGHGGRGFRRGSAAIAVCASAAEAQARPRAQGRRGAPARTVIGGAARCRGGSEPGAVRRGVRRHDGPNADAYVRARRLETVRSALEAGETDLARLAARCGFSSHAHMTRAFGAAFGLTPSAYRARFQQVHRGEASSHSGGASGRSAMG